MNKAETLKIMNLIAPIYYQRRYDTVEEERAQIQKTLAVMANLFEDQDYGLIEKATIRYMKSGEKFAPLPGQLITLAAEIRKAEWEERKRQADLLPEPKTEVVPCPEDIKRKMKDLFKMPTQ